MAMSAIDAVVAVIVVVVVGLFICSCRSRGTYFILTLSLALTDCLSAVFSR